MFAHIFYNDTAERLGNRLFCWSDARRKKSKRDIRTLLLMSAKS